MNQDLSAFYKLINRKLKIVSAYLQDEEIEWIIKACRFKPINSFFKNYSHSKILLEKKWVDEWNNSLIIENNEVKLIINDLELNIEQISTDLYYGRNPIEILKNSKLISIAITKRNDESIDIITMLGRDNFLRTFIIENNEINNSFSPVVMGLDLLRKCAILIGARGVVELKEASINYNSVVEKVFISSLPLDEEIILKMQSETSNNLNWLKEKN